MWTQGGRMGVSHAAMLADTGESCLLPEKTSQEAPYAATWFPAEGEVKGYRYRTMALSYSQYGPELGAYLTRQNNRPLWRPDIRPPFYPAADGALSRRHLRLSAGQQLRS